MKNKLGIKSRVFISFTIFIIIIVNIFTYFLYFFVTKNIKNNINKSIISEYETIKTFIDLQKTNIFSLPKYEIEKLNSMGLYFYIGNNDINIQKTYNIGSTIKNNEILFRGDYKGYNIIIGKKINDLLYFKQDFIIINIILNIILIFGVFIISYIITYTSLKPLLKLSTYLDNFNNSNKLIKNNYGNTEIGILTKSINKYILNNKIIIESQKSFIQDTNHELKTPLMQIHSNIELIEDKIIDENILKKIDSIKKSVNNINTIIINLGFILQGEEIPKKKNTIILYNYFLNLIGKYEYLIEEKNIKINIIKNNNIKIENNIFYLDRLFGNILSNAILYNKGNNVINIILNKSSIIISDKGIGIHKNEIKKIFDRFYRNPNSGLYYNEGNGLGLVIVKKICDMFGWKINVNSEIGKGTIFHIYINKN